MATTNGADGADGADGAIRGVNLGGWLLLEPWITPSLFPEDGAAVDEWTLCEQLGPERASALLLQHRHTWCTDRDVARLAAAGVTHVRVPVGYWAVDVAPGEPWVRGAWAFVLQLLDWCAAQRLRVLVDLHGVPGSQNGFDNSGRRGAVRWHAERDGVARTLRVVAAMAASLAQHAASATALFGLELVNEPASWALHMPTLRQFYLQAYGRVREHFPDPWSCAVVLHDAFLGPEAWQGFMQPRDGFENVLLDLHRYHCFDEAALAWSPDQHCAQAAAYGATVARSDTNLWTLVGEWSLATTDCAKWLNGHGVGARWDGTHPSRHGRGPVVPGARCEDDDTAAERARRARFFATQARAYAAGRGWFFWNFKTEGAVAAWDFLLGVQRGWIAHAEAHAAACFVA